MTIPIEIIHAAFNNDILKLLIQIAYYCSLQEFLVNFLKKLVNLQVLGEILAGIVLGPSLLGSLFPVIENWIMPNNSGKLICLKL